MERTNGRASAKAVEKEGDSIAYADEYRECRMILTWPT